MTQLNWVKAWLSHYENILSRPGQINRWMSIIMAATLSLILLSSFDSLVPVFYKILVVLIRSLVGLYYPSWFTAYVSHGWVAVCRPIVLSLMNRIYSYTQGCQVPVFRLSRTVRYFGSLISIELIVITDNACKNSSVSYATDTGAASVRYFGGSHLATIGAIVIGKLGNRMAL